MSRVRGLAVAAALAASCAGAGVAGAHGRSMSTSSWEIEPGPAPGAPVSARVVVRITAADLQPILASAVGPSTGAVFAPAVEQAVDAALVERFALQAGGAPCALSGPVSPVPTADATHLARRWSVRCTAPGPLAARIEAFFDTAPGHLHLARVRLGHEKPFERVVVIERRGFPIEAAGGDGKEQAGSALVDYVKLGVDHIVSGVDHLVFLLALLLAGRTAGQIAMIVTGFTAAHSVTLALGVLGVIRPSSAAIESLIGLSIAIVALENFVETVSVRLRRRYLAGLAACLVAAFAAALAGRFAVPPLTLAGVALFTLCYAGLLGRVSRPETLRWLIAFVFGLVHGFGFAGALAETALPSGRLAHALFGFNLGVELGQLVIVAVSWPILRLALLRSAPLRASVMQLGSAPVLAAGVFWFVSRAWS